MDSNAYNLETLQESIGYHFNQIALLEQALTHSSFANEMKINKHGDYERLEFLGDAVLELISSEFLYNTYPDLPEGKLTTMRASMVCEPTLAICARSFGLEKYIKLGRGEEHTGGRNRDSIVSDVLEAVIGALFLDAGVETAKQFIMRYILKELREEQLFHDAKSKLQEVIQKNGLGVLRYDLVGESGPDHARTFEVCAYLDDKQLGKGTGSSKKQAEQQAAQNALRTDEMRAYLKSGR
ncbi:MAG: ribonuclease III [Lachnospiraceae bacterium]|nr:ribonuclease III [Lachnospiraceae bacterium]